MSASGRTQINTKFQPPFHTHCLIIQMGVLKVPQSCIYPLPDSEFIFVQPVFTDCPSCARRGAGGSRDGQAKCLLEPTFWISIPSIPLPLSLLIKMLPFQELHLSSSWLYSNHPTLESPVSADPPHFQCFFTLWVFTLPYAMFVFMYYLCSLIITCLRIEALSYFCVLKHNWHAIKNDTYHLKSAYNFPVKEIFSAVHVGKCIKYVFYFLDSDALTSRALLTWRGCPLRRSGTS